MSCNMMTLHEIGMAWAKKQPGIIDDLTEDSPILDIIRVEGRQPQALERGRKAR